MLIDYIHKLWLCAGRAGWPEQLVQAILRSTTQLLHTGTKLLANSGRKAFSKYMPHSANAYAKHHFRSLYYTLFLSVCQPAKVYRWSPRRWLVLWLHGPQESQQPINAPVCLLQILACGRWLVYLDLYPVIAYHRLLFHFFSIHLIQRCIDAFEGFIFLPSLKEVIDCLPFGPILGQITPPCDKPRAIKSVEAIKCIRYLSQIMFALSFKIKKGEITAHCGSPERSILTCFLVMSLLLSCYKVGTILNLSQFPNTLFI